jgi:methylmalonyl-CoA mutase
VNRYLNDTPDDIPMLKVDNAAVLAAQIDKLKKLRAERDQAAIDAALEALTAGARGNANLLELAVQAARAKATVGEISDALEAAFGRHVATVKTVSGVYGKEAGNDPKVARARDMVATFVENEGGPPRILIAKLGQDGHDRGQKVVATGYGDIGFDVTAGSLFQTPAEAARDAVEKNVHAVGASSLAAGHLTLVPELRAELAKLGREDIMIVVGGVIPPSDVQPLLDMGAAAVYPPGSVIADTAADLIEKLNLRLGYAQPAPAEKK